jgi:hypothetical protein
MAMEIRPGSIRRGEEICHRHRWLSQMNALLDEEGAMGSAMQNGSARADLQSFAQSRFGAQLGVAADSFIPLVLVVAGLACQ